MIKKVLLLIFLLVCVLYVSTNVYGTDEGIQEPGIVAEVSDISGTIWEDISNVTSKIEIVIGFVAVLLSLSAYTLRLYSKYATNKKKKAEAEALAEKLDSYKRVSESINDLVEEAEKFNGYSGAEKKQYVTTRINQFCIDNEIEFDIKLVSDLIESAVTLTKTVNARGTISKNPEVKNEIL